MQRVCCKKVCATVCATWTFGAEGIQAPTEFAKRHVYAKKKAATRRGLAACKTLANKQPVASRRETASTQFNPSSETLFQLIQFQQKNASDGKQDVPLGQKYKNGF